MSQPRSKAMVVVGATYRYRHQCASSSCSHNRSVGKRRRRLMWIRCLLHKNPNHVNLAVLTKCYAFVVGEYSTTSVSKCWFFIGTIPYKLIHRLSFEAGRVNRRSSLQIL
ncbi:unnamed protein product [Urochloa humidicola]